MRLSDITQPFTIICINNGVLRAATEIIKTIFLEGKGQSWCGINRNDTAISVTKNKYYTLHVRHAEAVVYLFSDIDELAHLAQNTLTTSRWYDDVHTMD